jgi:hypothetical protein
MGTGFVEELCIKIYRKWSSGLFNVQYRAIITYKRKELATKKQLFLLFRLKVLNKFATFDGKFINPYFFEERRSQ